MDEHIRKDILDILNKSIRFVKSKDPVGLMDLSNRTVHDASIFQDEDSVGIAVIIYSLSKLIQRSDKSVSHKLSSYLKKSVEALSSKNISAFRKYMKTVIGEIPVIDSKLKLYIEEVVNQAQIKKGSRIYAHGISMARACEMLGVTQWEMMNYIGKTSIPDTGKDEFGIKSRLNLARSLFK